MALAPTVNTPVSQVATPSRSKSPPQKRKKKASVDPLDDYLLSELAKSSAPDECRSFGDHVAARLKTFSAQQRARACIEIDKVLYEIQYSSQQPVPSYPLYNTYPTHQAYDN